MATTIRLMYQGVPVDFDPDAGMQLADVLSIVKAARASKCEGQPLRLAGGFGNKGGKPTPIAPVRNAKGALCCPTHAGERRSELQRKEWANGVVYACGCKDEGAWCRYKLDSAVYDEFERTVAAVQPQTPPTVQPQPARTVSEARQRFFAQFKARIGGDTWAAVQAFWGDDALPEPQTVDAWRDEARELLKQLAHSA